MERIGGHTINKGYFSGKFVLRVWDARGETIHNSIHDLPEHARSELDRFIAAHKKARKDVQCRG